MSLPDILLIVGYAVATYLYGKLSYWQGVLDRDAKADNPVVNQARAFASRFDQPS